jgi:mRNA interferase MazF
MKRGDIFLANLNPSRGSEQAGIRPVILVQRNSLGQFTRTAIAVPLTSNIRRAQVPGTIMIPAGTGGLVQDSVALCYQAVVLDQDRFIRKVGELPQQYLDMLREALIYTLALEEPE